MRGWGGDSNSGSAWLLKGAAPHPVIPSPDRPSQLRCGVPGIRRKRQGPWVEGGRETAPCLPPCWASSQTGGPSALEKASRTLGGRNTQPRLLKGPRCRQREGDKPKAAFHQGQLQAWRGQATDGHGEIRWQGPDTGDPRQPGMGAHSRAGDPD